MRDRRRRLPVSRGVAHGTQNLRRNDPATADHVRWIFAQRLASESIAGIARTLNANGIPCPSDAAILTNPRYTGRQVWNRQRTDREPLDTPGRREREIVRSNIASTASSTSTNTPPDQHGRHFRQVQGVGARKSVTRYAACEYPPISPPRRSRRTTRDPTTATDG